MIEQQKLNYVLSEDELANVSGSMTFTNSHYDRLRLGWYAFWNGKLVVMTQLTNGVHVDDIEWRP